MEDKDKRTTAACQKSLRSHGGCLTSLSSFPIQSCYLLEIIWKLMRHDLEDNKRKLSCKPKTLAQRTWKSDPKIPSTDSKNDWKVEEKRNSE